MKMSVSAKRCPECGKAAVLQASCCAVCGHRFRTRFAEPSLERTGAWTLMVAPLPFRPLPFRPPGRAADGAWAFRRAFLSAFLVVALAGGMLWLCWSVWSSPPSGLPLPSAQAAPSVSRARQLYAAIKPMMSLYELDCAAGGMGRVVRDSDSHRLLLCYDYPPQSVRVSLSRTDDAGSTYQVQDVSLYQGEMRLRHHVGME